MSELRSLLNSNARARVFRVESEVLDSMKLTSVYVKSMTGAQRETLANLGKQEKNITDAELVAWCLCDEQGLLVYPDCLATDLAEIRNWDSQVSNTIARSILEVSGLTKEATDKAKKA